MKPHAPPPMDAPENVWRAYMADQLASFHECVETRMDATDARVETLHEENKQGREQVLAAIDEVKEMARSGLQAYGWVSTEEKQRERDALVEAGRQLEHDRWLAWWHRVEGFVNELWQWIGKPALGVALAYLVFKIRGG